MMGVLPLTADQAIQRMTQNTEASNWDLVFNWVKQGELQAKQFKKVMEKMTSKKEEKGQSFSFVKDKYSENREAMKKDLEEFFSSTPSPGGGKKKKKVS